jgi:hypothetical protein
MRDANYFLEISRPCTLILLILLLSISVAAQTPFFAAGTPSAASGTGNALSVTLPISNAGTATASSVMITSMQFSTATLISPSTLPVSIGNMPSAASFQVNASFNATGLAPGTKYLLTIRGTYVVGDSTLGFTVNRYVIVPALQGVISGGVQVTIPSGFQLDFQVLTLQGPITLNNFASEYDHGGLLPSGGADVYITSINLPTGSLNGFITRELRGATITSTGTISIAGASGIEVFFTDPFGIDTQTYKEIGVYVPHGNKLYKVYLHYYAGDPSEPIFLMNFQQVLNSMRFTS